MKEINLDETPDIIEIFANNQIQKLEHDLNEIKICAASPGYATAAQSNLSILVRAEAMERNASGLILMMRNPRGYLENVQGYIIKTK